MFKLSRLQPVRVNLARLQAAIKVLLKPCLSIIIQNLFVFSLKEVQSKIKSSKLLKITRILNIHHLEFLECVWVLMLCGNLTGHKVSRYFVQQ